jgi:hypothetical protein
MDRFDTATSTGTTPSESNRSPYPKHPASTGYAVSGYWDNGVWWERTDPVAVDSHGGVSYVYPETARLVYPPSAIIYTPPANTAPYLLPDSKAVRSRSY